MTAPDVSRLYSKLIMYGMGLLGLLDFGGNHCTASRLSNLSSSELIASIHLVASGVSFASAFVFGRGVRCNYFGNSSCIAQAGSVRYCEVMKVISTMRLCSRITLVVLVYVVIAVRSKIKSSRGGGLWISMGEVGLKDLRTNLSGRAVLELNEHMMGGRRWRYLIRLEREFSFGFVFKWGQWPTFPNIKRPSKSGTLVH